MAKNLVIVESPAKAKTINRYLGKEFIVKASMGHIRDLPKKELGVDIDAGLQPTYIQIPERKKTIAELSKTAKEVEKVLLAADPDREGEAICWHLSKVLERSNKNIFRVMFNEITKNSINNAFLHPGNLDENKINAQQTRRILDRLVGYLISPLLWKKVGRGLSAGRVQSIALRLICEREKEIKDFTQEEYWTITADLQANNPPEFQASLVKIDGEKAEIKTESQAAENVSELKKLPYILDEIKLKKKMRRPSPPYITSTLQQDCYRLKRFSVKKTMVLAQKLYEGLEIGDLGLEGLITYMRTDSLRISDEALSFSRQYISDTFSADYLPDNAVVYKNKKKIQDAHEAIRPTSFDLPPEKAKQYLPKDEFAVYTLIWNRFIASQMNPAVIEETEFQIHAGRYQFKAKGEVIIFDGFLALTTRTEQKEKKLPKAVQGESLTLLEIVPKQNFTQPPFRYTEGTLVKELEKKEIGRPSTYAPIISTIQDRVYVVKEQGKFIPTDLGLYVNDFLITNFPDLMEFKFTVRLEEDLDLISEGKKSWQDYLKQYYSLLEKDLVKAKSIASVKAQGIPATETCPECNRQLVIKEGRYGRFIACSGYPDCTYKKSLVQKENQVLEETCPECGSQLVVRHGKYGAFVSCSTYPKCKYIKKEKKDTGIACPLDCGGTIVHRKTRKGRIFFGCSNFPSCQFATWDEPISEACPKCSRPFILRKNAIKGNSHLYCYDEDCEYKEETESRKIWEKT